MPFPQIRPQRRYKRLGFSSGAGLPERGEGTKSEIDKLRLWMPSGTPCQVSGGAHFVGVISPKNLVGCAQDFVERRG